jgi:hypothetical protein
MTIHHFMIETKAGDYRLVSFANLPYTNQFNRPGSNNRIGDYIKVRPGVEGRIVKIKHEIYHACKGHQQKKVMSFTLKK